MFRSTFRTGIVATLAVIASAAIGAPRPWLLPSETSFAGSGDEWMTVDAALSTDLYYFDHPGQDWRPDVTAPDGSTLQIENEMKGRLRKVFDLHLTKRGTYKIAVFNETVSGSFLLEGVRTPVPRGTTPAMLATAIPANATDISVATSTTRLETFATAGEPTNTVFKPSGKGLEMVPMTHPTDLAVGERATFQFLLNGKPAARLPVSVVNGGVRYADRLQQMTMTTDADGKVSVNWPGAGMWWLSVTTGAGASPGGNASENATAKAKTTVAETPATRRPQGRDTYAMTVQVMG